jgi:hypothetical protein
MSKWTHLQCWECWRRENGTQQPFRTEDRSAGTFVPKHCCFCGSLTASNIYVRRAPAEVQCEGTKWIHASAS